MSALLIDVDHGNPLVRHVLTCYKRDQYNMAPLRRVNKNIITSNGVEKNKHINKEEDNRKEGIFGDANASTPECQCLHGQT